MYFSSFVLKKTYMGTTYHLRKVGGLRGLKKKV
jgi:hypothetical protein